MSTTKHTPLPYHVAYGAIYAGDTRILLADRETPATNPVERDATVAFAVRACNAHYDLVTTAEAALDALDALMGRLAKDAPQFLPPPADIAGEPWASILRGRAALAKAKGQP